MGDPSSPEHVHVTPRAVAALIAEGLDPSATFVKVQHVLGCGGSGFRLTFSDAPLPEGVVVATASGVRVCLDRYSHARLAGAAIDYDTEKETEGFFLDHEAAVFAAFC